MSLPAGSILFGFLAGMLSTASPCVLPLLPLVLGSAVSAHRLGLWVLAAGLATSFTAVGLLVATIGFSLGLDSELVRKASAVILGLFGVVLLSSALQDRFAFAAGGIGNLGNRLSQRIAPTGLTGQFLLGALLGAVWSPCVGPTLGAASLLAAQGRDLLSVAAVMLAFGAGAAAVLLIVGTLSVEAMRRWRGRMLRTGKAGKLLMGAATLGIAVLILSGADHALETLIVEHSPDWLIDVASAF